MKFEWKLIDADARTGEEVLLGFAGSRDMDFYRWNQDLADTEGHNNYPPEQRGWADRCSDPPHEMPTHYMIIEGPD